MIFTKDCGNIPVWLFTVPWGKTKALKQMVHVVLSCSSRADVIFSSRSVKFVFSDHWVDTMSEWGSSLGLNMGSVSAGTGTGAWKIWGCPSPPNSLGLRIELERAEGGKILGKVPTSTLSLILIWTETFIQFLMWFRGSELGQKTSKIFF